MSFLRWTYLYALWNYTTHQTQQVSLRSNKLLSSFWWRKTLNHSLHSTSFFDQFLVLDQKIRASLTNFRFCNRRPTGNDRQHLVHFWYHHTRQFIMTIFHRLRHSTRLHYHSYCLFAQRWIYRSHCSSYLQYFYFNFAIHFSFQYRDPFQQYSHHFHFICDLVLYCCQLMIKYQFSILWLFNHQNYNQGFWQY